MKVAIIGAGISGITSAYYLAKKGYNVNIIDYRRYPAMATSYANGGQISASNSEVWNSWDNIRKGIKWVFKKDAPFLVNPKISIEKIRWFYDFIRYIPQYRDNTIETCRMAVSSHALYKDIANKEEIEFDLVNKGIIHLYNTDKEVKHAEYVSDLYNKAGLERKKITHDKLYKIEPALKKKKFRGIYYTESDYTGDIHKFCVELLKVLKKKYKVQYHQYKVEDLNKINYEYDKVIVCAGVSSRSLSRTIGEDLPIYPVKGYSITINNPGRNAPWVSILDDSNKIVTSRLGRSRLRVAGTAEFNGYNLDIIQARIRPLIKWANEMFGDINTKDIKPWAGLRPMTPNMMPIVRKSIKRQDIWYNTGHGHLGWTLSAFTGSTIANLIANNE